MEQRKAGAQTWTAQGWEGNVGWWRAADVARVSAPAVAEPWAPSAGLGPGPGEGYCGGLLSGFWQEDGFTLMTWVEVLAGGLRPGLDRGLQLGSRSLSGAPTEDTGKERGRARGDCLGPCLH